jgi:hypothetical protein
MKKSVRVYAVYKNDKNNTGKSKFIPDALLTRYPNHAIYDKGKVALFAETLEQLTGAAHDDIENVAALGLREDDDIENPGQMKKSELDAMVDDLLTRTPKGSEVHLSLAQGKHLKKTKFKNEDEEL